MGWTWTEDSEGFRSRQRSPAKRGHAEGDGSGRWDCLVAECIAKGSRANWPGNTKCYCCLQPKPSIGVSARNALRAKLAAKDLPAQAMTSRGGAGGKAADPSSNRSRRKAERAAKRQADAATSMMLPPQVSETHASAKCAAEAAGPAVQDGAKNILIFPVTCNLADVVALSVSPPSPPALLKTAAEYLESFLPKSAVDSAAVAAAVKERELYGSAAAGMPESLPARASLDALIAATDAKSAKLQKAGKGPAFERAAFDHARTSLVKAASKHENIVSQAAGREEARMATAMQRIAAARADLDALEKAYVEKRAEQAIAWKAVNERRAKRDAEALTLLSEKIAELPQPEAGTRAPASVSTVTPASGAPWVIPALHFKQVFASEADLPQLASIDASDLPKLATLWGGVDAAIKNSEVVITMAEVCEDIAVPRTLVGDVIWNKFFESGSDMSTVLPCQLIWMLRHVLEGIVAKLQENAGHDAAMAAGRKRIEAAALEQARRRRSAAGVGFSPY